MASSSSNPQWIYDVFLSFRGVDVRVNFVSHLHDALRRASIETYIDYKLEKGTELGPELLRAIEGSKIALVVFSKNYAESSWCLRELQKIMECRKTTGQLVIPIFYHVDPADVRHQKNKYGRDLEKHATRYSQEVVEGWRRVLAQVANLSGWHLMDHSDEAAIVKNIVQKVLTILDDRFLFITDFPVGLEFRVQEVIKFIENQSSKICIVGIWGMGGSGKTTLAKAIYNKLRLQFRDKCFIENIREVCEKDRHIDLQVQLLSDILRTKVKIHSIHQGMAMIKKRLHGKRVLLVLDDVTELNQLNAQNGLDLDWTGPGSVVIVTTRNLRILNLLKVDHVYRMKKMDENESLELFNWHAFKEEGPTEDFIELSKNAVDYCDGLPLALEVLGSYLYERKQDIWQSVLLKLRKIPHSRIQGILRISFDGLRDQMHKDIFLDICFFFIGENRVSVTEILNGCGLHADEGIEILIERSLMKVDKNNKLRMHDLLRDMGREIVRESSPQEPEKRSRLWFHEDVLDVLGENTGTEAVKGLALKSQRTNVFGAHVFEKMKRLRLLQLDRVKLTGDYGYLSKRLRWVCWQGFPLKYLPDNFYQEELVAIDFKHSKLRQVWKEAQLLVRLKFLNLSHSLHLTNTPDFSKLPNLERLILKDCPCLLELHHSIGDLTKLVLLNLKNCTRLPNLQREAYNLTSLKTLILSGCPEIDKLEEDVGKTESLTTLIAKDTAIKQVPFSLVRSKAIGYISLPGCEGLARDVFPPLIWSWMSPKMNPLSFNNQSGAMSLSLISKDLQNNNAGHLSSMLISLSKFRGVCVQCDSESQLTQELSRILDDMYDVNLTESEATSRASQMSENFLSTSWIRLGRCEHVLTTLSKSISKGFTINGLDVLLPGDKYPYWLCRTGEGRSVSFQLPEDYDFHLIGMILCVVYSSTTENMALECLNSIMIVNRTKCNFQIYNQDTTISFNDEDWLGLISNLEPGDNVEIFICFGHRFTIKKTVVYLVYGESTSVEMEPSTIVEMEPSTIVEMEPSTSVEMEASTSEPSPRPNKKKNIFKAIFERLCLK